MDQRRDYRRVATALCKQALRSFVGNSIKYLFEILNYIMSTRPSLSCIVYATLS